MKTSNNSLTLQVKRRKNVSCFAPKKTAIGFNNQQRKKKIFYENFKNCPNYPTKTLIKMQFLIKLLIVFALACKISANEENSKLEMIQVVSKQFLI